MGLHNRIYPLMHFFRCIFRSGLEITDSGTELPCRWNKTLVKKAAVHRERETERYNTELWKSVIWQTENLIGYESSEDRVTCKKKNVQHSSICLTTEYNTLNKPAGTQNKLST